MAFSFSMNANISINCFVHSICVHGSVPFIGSEIQASKGTAKIFCYYDEKMNINNWMYKYLILPVCHLCGFYL